MTRIQPRRGTAAEWAAANPVLALGELGYTTDTRVVKRGDGVTPWNSLTVPDLAAAYLQALGGQGVTNSIRFVGRMNSSEGPPTSGSWLVGDVIEDRWGTQYRCAISGTPGTWRNNGAPGFMNQQALDQGGLATYVDGGPVTLSASPTNLPVHDAASFPDPVGTATDLIIGLAVFEGNDEIRYFATYTGKSGNTLTGVVMKDGTTQEIANHWGVWYAKSGLANSCMRVPNQIVARGSFDGKPHDLVLLACYDDWRTVLEGRADYDIILDREAGSNGQLSIRLPINFGMDMPFLDAGGNKIIEFAAGDYGNGNQTNPNPMDPLDVALYGRLRGANGSSESLILRNSGAVNSQIALQSSDGATKFGVDETAIRIANNILMRFYNVAGTGFGSISVSNSDTMLIRVAGANGVQFNNSAATAAIFRIDNTGKAFLTGTAACLSAGTGTPEGVVTAAIGSIFLRTDGGAGTTMYLKQSGAGNTGWVAASSGGGSGDASTNTATSVDNELVLFSGTGGKTLKRAALTGLAKMTAGVLSAAAAGTDYVVPGGALGTPSSATLTNATGLLISGLVASTSLALGVGTVELGHATDTTLSRSAAGRLAVEGVNAVLTSSTDTLTNKRITDRVSSGTSSATLPVNADSFDMVVMTAQAENATLAAPTGTPTNGQALMYRIKPTGTFTLGYNAIFRAIGVTLPTATASGKTIYLGCKYNSTDSTWDVLAVAVQD